MAEMMTLEEARTAADMTRRQAREQLEQISAKISQLGVELAEWKRLYEELAGVKLDPVVEMPIVAPPVVETPKPPMELSVATVNSLPFGDDSIVAILASAPDGLPTAQLRRRLTGVKSWAGLIGSLKRLVREGRIEKKKVTGPNARGRVCETERYFARA